MTKTLEDFLARRPVDRARVEAHERRMSAQERGYRLRALREQAGLTQAELAARIGVGDQRTRVA